jgi:hypothetical protein
MNIQLFFYDYCKLLSRIMPTRLQNYILPVIYRENILVQGIDLMKFLREKVTSTRLMSSIDVLSKSLSSKLLHVGHSQSEPLAPSKRETRPYDQMARSNRRLFQIARSRNTSF